MLLLPLPAAASFAHLHSVVTIVVANKVVMTNYMFSFPVCLTFFHSVITALGERSGA